jgi:hypothetical protein
MLPPKRSSHHLDVKFKVGSSTFSVKKSLLLDRLAFFQEDTSRLNEHEFEVKTQVPPEIFTEFVKFIEGHPIEITEATLSFYRSLSEEFGFETLSTKCDLFEQSHSNLSQKCVLTENETLCSRICEFEER